MGLRQQLEVMADYHVWANRRLYDQVDRLDHEAYSGNCGLFFRSVHATLNHIAVVDEIWARRLSGEGPEHLRLDAEIESDRDRLCARVFDSASRWRRWLDSCPDELLHGDFAYKNLAGQAFRLPVASTVLHAVNHGTHHRGQISAALTRHGIDAPVMDLPYFLLERRS